MTDLKGYVCFLKLLASVALLLITHPLRAAQSKKQKPLCAHIVVITDEDLRFSDTEKRMLCGDPKLKPWSDIPPFQARFFMKSFLQSRGYLTPSLKVVNGKLIVRPGERTKVNEILITPQSLVESRQVEKEIWGLYEGKVITPSLLDAMQASVVGELRRKAYACAKFKALANANTGVVVLNGEALTRYKFGNVEKERVEGLYESALDRFYPFTSEEAFNASKLELTEKRLKRAGVVAGSYFLENCDDVAQEFSLRHMLIKGPPRILAFGLGVSTERGPMLSGRWAHNRLGPMASQVQATVEADFRKQSISARSDNYLWKSRPRRSIRSEVELANQTQVDYRETNLMIASHGKWSRDTLERYWEWRLGPSYFLGNFVTDEGVEGEGNYKGLAIEGFLTSMSHRFELFDFLPEKGSSFRFHFDFRSPELGFNERLLMLEAQHTALGRLWKWGRGDAVGGVRFGAFTTIVDNPSLIADLPPSVKFYGGGSDDIRGFYYKTLPENNGLGALTKLLAKFELRKTHFFRPGLEVFAFYDAGMFGFASWELSQRLYQSPGIGLRWVSPVGLLQTFAAKGSVTRPTETRDTLFFVGLGGEF